MPAGAFFNGQAFATAETQMAIAKETTRGSLVSTGLTPVPVMGPKYKPNLMLLPVDVLEGSMVQTYDEITGIRYDSHGWSAPPYLGDSFPIFVECELGSPDNLTAAVASTTLAAAATPGATTISTAASIAKGSWIVMGSAALGTIETHYVNAVPTGAGPYTITLAQPVINNQASGATVTGLTKHQFSLLNSGIGTTYNGTNNEAVSAIVASTAMTVISTSEFQSTGGTFMVQTNLGVCVLSYTGTTTTSFTGIALVSGTSSGTVATGNQVNSIGSQPPSVSLWDFDGEQWRAITACQLDELTIKGSGTSLVEYTCTWFGNPANTYQQIPTVGAETNKSPAPWSFFLQIGGTAGTAGAGSGTYNPTCTDWEVSLKRNVKPIPALTGLQQYYQYFAGPIVPTFKLTFLEQPGSPQLNAFLNATQQPIELTVFDQTNGYALNIRGSLAQYTTGEIDRTKEWVDVVVDGIFLPSTGDALAGGVSPCVITVANSNTSPV